MHHCTVLTAQVPCRLSALLGALRAFVLRKPRRAASILLPGASLLKQTPEPIAVRAAVNLDRPIQTDATHAQRCRLAWLHRMLRNAERRRRSDRFKCHSTVTAKHSEAKAQRSKAQRSKAQRSSLRHALVCLSAVVLDCRRSARSCPSSAPAMLS